MRRVPLLRAGVSRRATLTTTSWLVPFLAATLLLVLWLGWQAVVAVWSQRSAAESALRDYARTAAWQYSRLARENLDDFLDHVFDDVPRRVQRRDLPGPRVVEREMAHAIRDAGCACPELLDPERFFRVDLREAGGADGGDGVERRIAAALNAAVGSSPERRDGLLVLRSGEVLAGPALVGYALASDSAGPRVAYGFVTRATAIDALLRVWYLTGELLPPAVGDGLPNDSLLHIAVRDANGVTLFESSVTYPDALAETDTIGARFGDLVVEASIRPDAAGRVIIGGLPASRLPLILTLLILTLGVGAAALVQIRRERELARLRDDFISGVSHELRTPLAQIRLFAELEETGRLRGPEDRARATRVIHRESERLTHLVENILRFSRLRRAPVGREGLREEILLSDAIPEVVHGFEPLAHDARVRLNVDVAERLRVRSNRDALQQIVVNLLDNAVKYGPAGQTVTVRATSARGAVRLSVDDEGPGVPPRDRRRIWEAYRRLERDVEGARPGTGIGLALVAELTAQQGGRAWVEDAPGGGARFVVELPAAAPAAGPVAPEAAPPEVHA